MPAPDNILIYRLGSLGDTIMALPCFHLIRMAFPRSRITLLTNRPVSAKASLPMAILDQSGLCDDYLDYPVGTRSSSVLAALRRSICQVEPRLLINLAAARGLFNSLRDYLFFRCCGIQEIVGTPFRRRDLSVQRVEGGGYEPESQRLASRLAALGTLDLSDRNLWKLGISPEEKRHALALLPCDPRPCLAVSIGTKLPVNDWGAENWKKLLAALSREKPRATLVMLGSADEWERSRNIGRVWSGLHVNLCGKTSPRLAAAILERCSVFIGHDSGLMHLAGAVGVPTLGLFSWYNPPGQWFPGNRQWRFIQPLYPRLPAGGWKNELRMKNASDQGIQLLKPEFVLRSAMVLWNSFNSEALAEFGPVAPLARSEIH